MTREKGTQFPSKIQEALNKKRMLWRETFYLLFGSMLASILLSLGLLLIGTTPEVAVSTGEICTLAVPALGALTRKNAVTLKLVLSMLAIATPFAIVLQSWLVFCWIVAVLFIVFLYLSFIRAYH